jgi:GDPmannose 4,6-dehydratase
MDFCDLAFSHFGLLWGDYVVTDPAFERPADVPYLLGSPDKAKNELDWCSKVSFEEMVSRMCEFWKTRIAGVDLAN